LLLYGHVDVVTTAHQQWTHPPFEGKLVDGYLWGRGALDMKGGVAMLLAALLRARAEGLRPPGDVVLAIVPDEEGGGGHGAAYLAENHPGPFRGVRYAVGEFGGFSAYMAGRRFYPIQVAEKHVCWIRAVARGPGGHGSLPMRGGAMAKTARLLAKLDRRRLPVHVTPVVATMFQTVAAALPWPSSWLVRQLLRPRRAGLLLRLIDHRKARYESLFRNTVNATVVRGGESITVIPSEIELKLDGRLLPGQTADDAIRELRRLLGEEVELEVIRYDPGPSEPDMGMFDRLADVLREADPNGVAVPMLLAGATDARFVAKLGIQTYGFLPMQLPPDFDFIETIHAADERIPVEAVEFGARAIYRLLQRFGG
jgi:acetylornithine deacetylase/succinyl-diaminopimelate desuccinylase-like protein